jgi:hypothetical protein
MILTMFWSRSHAALRRAASALAIACFFGGANFCVLSALQGAPMGCLGVVGESAPKISHCGHPIAGPTATGKAGRPLTLPTSSPCCVHVAQVDAPHLDKADAGAPTISPAAENVAVATPGAAAKRRDRARDESPPPRPDLRVASPGRAPPLA